jgi:hypothetical protein
MNEFGALALGAVGLLNRIVVTGILITAFALIIYIGLYNRRSRIARSFAILLGCIIGTFLMELFPSSRRRCDLHLAASAVDRDRPGPGGFARPVGHAVARDGRHLATRKIGAKLDMWAAVWSFCWSC